MGLGRSWPGNWSVGDNVCYLNRGPSALFTARKTQNAADFRSCPSMWLCVESQIPDVSGFLLTYQKLAFVGDSRKYISDISQHTMTLHKSSVTTESMIQESNRKPMQESREINVVKCKLALKHRPSGQQGQPAIGRLCERLRHGNVLEGVINLIFAFDTMNATTCLSNGPKQAFGWLRTSQAGTADFDLAAGHRWFGSLLRSNE